MGSAGNGGGHERAGLERPDRPHEAVHALPAAGIGGPETPGIRKGCYQTPGVLYDPNMSCSDLLRVAIMSHG